MKKYPKKEDIIHKKAMEVSNRETKSYIDLLSKIIERIQEAPLLFIIAIVILLIPIIASANKLGTDNFRFVVWIVAGLATIGILAYYLFRVVKQQLGLRKETKFENKLHKDSVGTSTTSETMNSNLENDPKLQIHSTSEKDFSNQIDIVKILSEKFDIEEFKNLCFNLGVSYDGLRGEGLNGKARELVKYLQRRGNLKILLIHIKESRPDIILPN